MIMSGTIKKGSMARIHTHTLAQGRRVHFKKYRGKTPTNVEI